MRVFFCFDLQPDLKVQIYKKFSHLRHSTVRVSWVKPENMHITLKFLGEVDERRIEDFKEAAQTAITNAEVASNIKVVLERIGAFPAIERPRVVWIGPASEPQAVISLAAALESQLVGIGFEPERKPFTTHVTLGRVKDQSRSLRELTELIQRTPPFAYKASISRLTLMESKLSPQGSVYRPVFELPFES